jgi:hypothetical protein
MTPTLNLLYPNRQDVYSRRMQEQRVTSTLEGSQVVLRITCTDHYEAIQLHDSILRAAGHGEVVLKIEGLNTVQPKSVQRSE